MRYAWRGVGGVGSHLHDLLLLRARRKPRLDLGVALFHEETEPCRSPRLSQLTILTVGAEQNETPLAPSTYLFRR